MTTVIDCRPHAGAAPTPDLKAIKAKQHAAWSSGDYAVIGATIQLVGERLAEAMDLHSGERVLDIAAGNGNITLAAARRWCDVTSTDYVDALLARGRKRAEAEGFEINFQIADAENLPFKDGSYDAVVSTFGAMFSPDQSSTASEMQRVCRSGGRIGLANWTPDGFIGQMFKTIGKYLPPPAGAKSPALWGTREWIEAQLASGVRHLAILTQTGGGGGIRRRVLSASPIVETHDRQARRVGMTSAANRSRPSRSNGARNARITYDAPASTYAPTFATISAALAECSLTSRATWAW